MRYLLIILAIFLMSCEETMTTETDIETHEIRWDMKNNPQRVYNIAGFNQSDTDLIDVVLYSDNGEICKFNDYVITGSDFVFNAEFKYRTDDYDNQNVVRLKVKLIKY